MPQMTGEHRSWWKRLWSLPAELRRIGVLGINRRNAEYILPHNPRGHYPRVDDKLLTKAICEARGIRVPHTYVVVERYGDVRRLDALLGDRNEFVVKPCNGAEGRGIVVVQDRHDGQWVTAGGERISPNDFQYHVGTILAGLYSLGGQPDRALLEQRILRHPAFSTIAVGGTPDIRIVLYRCVPVMAMVRLPTRASRGRANLHQGAVAAGIDLATGKTFGGVCLQRVVQNHPDTGVPIAGHRIPGWDDLLTFAMRAADGLELGYLGVDFVLDANLGPVLLEANARPGLAIQIANRRGLERRLRYVDQQPPTRLGPEERLRLMMELAELE
jgi:alpha-L-glutamate ligase-like protein